MRLGGGLGLAHYLDFIDAVQRGAEPGNGRLDTFEIYIRPADHDLQGFGLIVHFENGQFDLVFAPLGEKSAEFEYVRMVWFEDIQHQTFYQDHAASTCLGYVFIRIAPDGLMIDRDIGRALAAESGHVALGVGLQRCRHFWAGWGDQQHGQIGGRRLAGDDGGSPRVPRASLLKCLIDHARIAVWQIQM